MCPQNTMTSIGTVSINYRQDPKDTGPWSGTVMKNYDTDDFVDTMQWLTDGLQVTSSVSSFLALRSKEKFIKYNA